MNFIDLFQASQDVLRNLPSPHTMPTLTDVFSGPDPNVTFSFNPISFLWSLLSLVSACFVFKKADKPWWAAIIPIYNVLVMLEIIGRPWWWLLLLFVPFVNIYIAIKMQVLLSKAFGKSAGFAVGLVLLNPVFMAILAFGNATYQGPIPAGN